MCFVPILIIVKLQISVVLTTVTTWFNCKKDAFYSSYLFYAKWADFYEAKSALSSEPFIKKL